VLFRLDSAIALSFLERYPTPESASKLGVGRMRQFCDQASYTGGKSADDLLHRLRSAPSPASPLSSGIVAALVSAHVAVLRQILVTIKQLEVEIERAVAAHPRAPLLATLPRVGRLNLAQILGEVGPVLDSAIDVDHACAQVGASPVTRESGKQRHVSFRWTANTRARKALTTFADNSRHNSGWAASRYDAARQRHKRHPHAVRILTRSWMRVIWAC
jgi:transposase